jgi:hypothetical protein
MMLIVQLMHVVIALAYFVLAVITTLLVRLPEEWETWAARAGGGLFFLGCGLHHIEFMAHAASGDPLDFLTWHHMVPGFMQVIGAPVFVMAILPYAEQIAAVLRVPKRRERRPDGDGETMRTRER